MPPPDLPRPPPPILPALLSRAPTPAGFSLEDPNTFAGRIYRMVKLGLSIDDDVAGAGADLAGEELPELEENVDEGSRMEEVGAGAAGCCWVLLGAAGCCWVLLLMDACGCLWVLRGSCGCLWALLMGAAGGMQRLGVAGCWGAADGCCSWWVLLLLPSAAPPPRSQLCKTWAQRFTLPALLSSDSPGRFILLCRSTKCSAAGGPGGGCPLRWSRGAEPPRSAQHLQCTRSLTPCRPHPLPMPSLLAF